jgi:peptidyl-prolyl cis-trans isomerase A (cyclophilin A)
MSSKQIIVSILFLIFVGGMIIFSINKNDQNSNANLKEESASENNLTDSNTKNMKATIQTNKGNIVLELYSEQTPKTAGNFADLAKKSFYDGTKFHRVISGFMIQGGDPQSKEDGLEMMWGTGGPGYQFEDEIVAGLSNVTGTISMANAGPNTNGSQFFINVADNTFLDGKHAVFGKVIEGMDVVMAISQTETKPRDIPVEPVILEKVIVE